MVMQAKTKTIMLLVTYKCNLHCSYCYEPKNSFFQMNAEKMKESIMCQVSCLGEDYESFEVQFMGGEPLLVFPLIQEVSEWLWAQSFQKKMRTLFAPTNGTLLNEEMKDWLVKNKSRFCLGLSFDGNNLMQDTNRSDSFHNIDIGFFSSTWPEQSVKMTLSPDTIGTFVAGITYLGEQGFKEVTADLAMGENVIWKKQHLVILKEQLDKLVNLYVDGITLPKLSMLSLEIEKVLETPPVKKSCSCGEQMVCIDFDGKQYACHLFSPIACNRDKALKSQEYDFASYDQFVSASCNNCSLLNLCNRCAGMSYLCSNDLSTQSAFHCNAFKIIYLANCKLQFQLAIKEGNDNRTSYIKKLVDSFKL